MATAIILSPSIAFVAVALRVYTRRVLIRVRFLEDICIVVAMACSIILSIFMGISTINGFGRHVETVTKAELTAQFKVGIGGIIFYILTHLALKLSILLQYVRISVMPFEKRFCYVIIAILVAQSLAMVCTHLALCRPFYSLWTPNVPGVVCLDRTKVYYAQLGMTIVMDFGVLVAPLFILRHLTLPWAQKLMILVVLSFGGMACIISVLRLLTVVQSTQSTDPTYDKVGSALYGVIEPNLGIFCASIVTLRPLFNRVAPHLSRRLGIREDNNAHATGREHQQGDGGDGPSLRRWFRRPAMFSFIAMSSSKRNKADKDFVMLSSDLSSHAASRGSMVGERKDGVRESAKETGLGTGRKDEEAVLEGTNRTGGS